MARTDHGHRRKPSTPSPAIALEFGDSFRHCRLCAPLQMTPATQNNHMWVKGHAFCRHRTPFVIPVSSFDIHVSHHQIHHIHHQVVTHSRCRCLLPPLSLMHLASRRRETSTTTTEKNTKRRKHRRHHHHQCCHHRCHDGSYQVAGNFLSEHREKTKPCGGVNTGRFGRIVFCTQF